jgi:ribosomal protein S18 acetylase RimI-like enzyme
MGFEIRRLQRGDEQLTLQVVRELMPADERDGREPGLEHRQRLLAQDSNYLIVATDGSRPVGFLTAYRMPSLCCDAAMVYIFEIEVAPAYRRQGIGKEMVNLLKRLCGEDGCGWARKMRMLLPNGSTRVRAASVPIRTIVNSFGEGQRII